MPCSWLTHSMCVDFNIFPLFLLSVQVLESLTTSGISSQFAIRKSMAMNLLTGEVRVLQSACAWLANYCANVSVSSEKEISEN